ncbi:MAG: diguanylate cyclase [Candidatus Omnitrophica bacterium]|nr:diguanylate cyclase [Candidatus Omnitrophota bacterium]
MDNDIFSRVVKNIILKAIAITAVLCFFYTAWISDLKIVQISNLKLFDSFFSLKYRINGSCSKIDDMVLVAVDDESVRNMDVRWPWPRSFVAEIIQKISDEDPAVIAVDLIFTGKSQDQEQDRIFVDVLKNTSNVISASYFGNDGRHVVPEENIVKNIKAYGFVNKPRDQDGVVRKMRPVALTGAGEIIDYSLSVKVSGEFLDQPYYDIISELPLLENHTAYIQYGGSKKDFTTIPAWKILKEKADISGLKDKIVFLGVSAEVFHDSYPTPLGSMPGVLIAANETATYMTRDYFNYSSEFMNFMILFFFVFIAILAALRISVLHGILLNTVQIIIFSVLGFFLLSKNLIIDYSGVIILIVIPSILLYGGRYVNLAIENMMLKKESITDGLTRLYGYKYFDLRLKLQLKKTLTGGKSFSLEMYDIDHFKNVNDTYGHEFGNVVLKAVAGVLSDNCRKSDTVARFGGEEFCILMPGAKQENALKHADRIREKIKALEFTTEKGEEVKITISGGIVSTEEYISDDHLNILRAADTALYSSKDTGRDKISIFDKEDKLLEEKK